ncbi:MAG TPA: DUF4410 domain-containing protein [Anaeromyxobacter sp.]
MMRRSLTFLAVMALAAGCASNPGKRQKIIDDEVARLRAPEIPLTSFGAFEIRPIAMSPDVQEKPEKVAVASDLGQRLEAQLRPTLDGWAAAAPAPAKGRTLVIQPTVVNLRIVGGASRFWLGAMAGDSSIDVDLQLVDKASGRAIAKERIAKSSGGMSGAWSMGATDKNLTQYVIDIANAYLVKYHP